MKDVKDMTKAEFAAAKYQLQIQANHDAKKWEGDRAIEKIKARHDNPPQPVEVVPFKHDDRAAPVGDGLARLP